MTLELPNTVLSLKGALSALANTVLSLKGATSALANTVLSLKGATSALANTVLSLKRTMTVLGVAISSFDFAMLAINLDRWNLASVMEPLFAAPSSLESDLEAPDGTDRRLGSVPGSASMQGCEDDSIPSRGRNAL